MATFRVTQTLYGHVAISLSQRVQTIPPHAMVPGMRLATSNKISFVGRKKQKNDYGIGSTCSHLRSK